jgi:hypothetical protein
MAYPTWNTLYIYLRIFSTTTGIQTLNLEIRYRNSVDTQKMLGGIIRRCIGLAILNCDIWGHSGVDEESSCVGTYPVLTVRTVSPPPPRGKVHLYGRAFWVMCSHTSRHCEHPRNLESLLRPGCGLDLPFPCSAEVKERVELYLYSPCRA